MIFDEFWCLYPRKIARKYAEKCWNRLSEAEQQAAIEALPRHVRVWRAEGRSMEHVPHSSSWINGARWEDELTMPEPVKPRMTVEELARERGITAGVGESMADFTRRVMAARH